MKIWIPAAAQYEDMGDGRRIRLIADFVVIVDSVPVVVPRGFVSDLASVPWLFRRAFPRFGPWNAAAIVHDWLYQAGRIGGREITRRQADEVFLAVMRANPKCPGWKARAMYVGVRLGAEWVWRGYRRKGERKFEI
jgi:hypothetical protein